MVSRYQVCFLFELETEFLQTWCIFMSSTTAIVEVAKVHQRESDHICVYLAKFEKYCRFFQDTLTEDAVISLFLKKCPEGSEGPFYFGQKSKAVIGRFPA